MLACDTTIANDIVKEQGRSDVGTNLTTSGNLMGSAKNDRTVRTQFVEGDGIRFAYRRFGKPVGQPLVFNQQLAGTMDNWDPTITDGLAQEREVILFNNAGVSGSSGEVPST